jgi:1-phosphatidylinositol phosphodiesterase
MSGLSDSLQLSSLFLAGTHDSAARFGWPFASCQSLFATLRRQLEDGVRFLDLRFALREGSVLVCCHGPLVQLLTARGALLAIYEFLERNPRETVIVSIKQEAGGPDERVRFAESVMRLVEMDGGMWYTEAQRIPRLGEVRGRCILFSRFGESEKPRAFGRREIIARKVFLEYG